MFELKQVVVEPRRDTFTPVSDRLGDSRPSRYDEATVGVQATDNFHYKPTWDTEHEIFDPTYSALRLSGPDSFLDPRQLYYATYVSSRAQRADRTAQVVEYLEIAGPNGGLPSHWARMLLEMACPLRHAEAGASLVALDGTRYAWGAPIASACGFAAMDRLYNAQLLTEVAMALGGAEAVPTAKARWMEATELQPIRRFVETLLVESDWAVATLAQDQLDRRLYRLLYKDWLDKAVQDGAQTYSLLARSFHDWYEQQRRWLDALSEAWSNDDSHGETNRGILLEIDEKWVPLADEAVEEFAQSLNALVANSGAAETPNTTG